MKISKIKEKIEEKYLSVIQTYVLLADTQNLVVDAGRGSGKTTEMFAPRIVRVSYDMPRSILLLVAPTYTFILDTIVPGILNHMAQNYVRGVEYDYGRRPPEHFAKPYTEVIKWEHTISFVWGTVIQFVSIDRPESAIGKNSAHIFADEVLRIKQTDFIERILPTLRGDRAIHGHSPYFMGITLFSSTPNLENDHDWWLEYESNMNKEIIDQIKYVAYRVKREQLKLLMYKQELEDFKKSGRNSELKGVFAKIERSERFIKKWEAKLKQKRKGQWTFIKASSFSNLKILGLEYITNQFKGAKSSIDKALLSILGIRPRRVKDLFFAKFDKHHIFSDSYNYKGIDSISVAEQFKIHSRYLKHCDPYKPLVAGYDPGGFQSIVFGQEFQNTLWLLKNFYAISPREHHELAQDINNFFQKHQRKTIYLHYDRAGNQKKQKYKDNPKGDTDATILKSELSALGWDVILMSTGQRTIYFWEHFILLSEILSERKPKVPKFRICQNECEEAISSIYFSPLKKTTDGSIELDKTAERKLDYKEQAWYSPQIATAIMYLVFGLFEKWMPKSQDSLNDYEGV